MCIEIIIFLIYSKGMIHTYICTHIFTYAHYDVNQIFMQIYLRLEFLNIQTNLLN